MCKNKRKKQTVPITEKQQNTIIKELYHDDGPGS